MITSISSRHRGKHDSRCALPLPGSLRCHPVAPRFGKKGFTLIELLTVIVIVVILAGVLIPTFQTARRNTIQAQAISNARQIGMSILAYAADNDGYAPRVEPNAWREWIATLYRDGYISDYSVFESPADTVKNKETVPVGQGGSEQRSTVISYGLNESLMNYQDSTYAYTALTAVPVPSIMPMIAESSVPVINGFTTSHRARVTNPNAPSRWSPPLTPNPALARHKGGNVVCFVDGHTRIVDQQTSQYGYTENKFNYSITLNY